MKQIKELEKYQKQFINYGETLLKVLLRNKKEREFLIAGLITYLSNNPDVKIKDVQVKLNSLGQGKKYTYNIKIKFKCIHCNNVVEEDHFLIESWIPPQMDGGPCCEECLSSLKDEEAYDDNQEERYLENQQAEYEREQMNKRKQNNI